MSLYRKWELRERVELPQHELHIEHTDSYRGVLRTWRLLVSSWLRLNFYYNNPFVLYYYQITTTGIYTKLVLKFKLKYLKIQMLKSLNYRIRHVKSLILKLLNFR